MIHSIYVVNKSGETLAAINRGDFDMDEALFGGFLSAIQIYSQKMAGQGVSELTLDEYKMVITDVSGVFLVTIHDQLDKDPIASNSRLVSVLEGVPLDIVTDDTIELLKKAAADPESGSSSASEWASKML